MSRRILPTKNKKQNKTRKPKYRSQRIPWVEDMKIRGQIETIKKGHGDLRKFAVTKEFSKKKKKNEQTRGWKTLKRVK